MWKIRLSLQLFTAMYAYYMFSVRIDKLRQRPESYFEHSFPRYNDFCVYNKHKSCIDGTVKAAVQVLVLRYLFRIVFHADIVHGYCSKSTNIPLVLYRARKQSCIHSLHPLAIDMIVANSNCGFVNVYCQLLACVKLSI